MAGNDVYLFHLPGMVLSICACKKFWDCLVQVDHCSLKVDSFLYMHTGIYKNFTLLYKYKLMPECHNSVKIYNFTLQNMSGE